MLQTNNIHIKVCTEGEVTKTLADLKASPATTKAKAKFVLATDGARRMKEAEASVIGASGPGRATGQEP